MEEECVGHGMVHVAVVVAVIARVPVHGAPGAAEIIVATTGGATVVVKVA